MTRKRILAAVQAVLLTALVGSFATPAGAEDIRGRFRLTNEVRWGKAVLQPGFYTITVQPAAERAIIRSSNGKAALLAVAWYVDGAVEGVSTGLLVTQYENERIVTALNLPGEERAFVYESVPGADLARFARAESTESVPVLWTAP